MRADYKQVTFYGGLEDYESWMLHMALKVTAHLGGDIAEIGAGGSSQLIGDNKGDKQFHVFDTFEGLPDPGEEDNPLNFHKGMFPNLYEDFLKIISIYKNIQVYKGLFPEETGHFVENKKFSLVHLDADLFTSTLNSLTFFYPRMVRGGIIISHDYSTEKGVKKAIDEFFADKKEQVHQLHGSQCLVVKL